MSFKLNALAATLIMAVSAPAFAIVDIGAQGDGELFFSIWNGDRSYTRSLETSLTSFESKLAAPGNLDLSFTADATYTSFLGQVADKTTLSWNVLALDSKGSRRLLVTYTAPEPTETITDDVTRSAILSGQVFLGDVNETLLATGQDSAIFLPASPAYAGNEDKFGTKIVGFLNFDNTGTLANNSAVNGLGFMKINAFSSGTEASVYNEYMDNGFAVNAWLDSDNSLHFAAAVPEAETYGMMLAGLGLVGFMARRRLAA